jgi:hypothetical protein
MILLIYNKGDEWNERMEKATFSTEQAMIDFVNREKLGTSVFGCYNITKEIDIEPFEKVTEYRVKD